MTYEKIKRMFDAFYQAKRIRDMLPPLPQGVMPSYIQYLDAIHSLQKEKKDIRISDLSDAMNLPRPGVTRTEKEMEAKGYLQKLTSPDDGRVTYISITEKGERLSRKYDQDYFSSLAPYLSEISEEEADNMIRTIGKFYQIMCDRREHYDKRKGRYYPGKYPEKAGCIYDAGTRCADPAGCLWCGRSSCSWKLRFHIRTVSGFHRKSGTESGYLCSDPVCYGYHSSDRTLSWRKKTGADRLRYRWGCDRLYHDFYRAVYCYGRFCTSDLHADAGTGRSGSADCILSKDLWKLNFLYCRV